MKTMKEVVKAYSNLSLEVIKRMENNCPDFKIYDDEIKRDTMDLKDIAEIEKMFNVKFGDDFKELLTLPKTFAKISSGNNSCGVSIGLDFTLTKSYLIDDINVVRNTAKMLKNNPNVSVDERYYELANIAIPINGSSLQFWYCNGPKSEKPEIYFLTPDRMPLFGKPISNSLTEFLIHFMSSGFKSINIDNKKLQKKILEGLIPFNVPEKENKWLKYYKAFYK